MPCTTLLLARWQLLKVTRSGSGFCPHSHHDHKLSALLRTLDELLPGWQTQFFVLEGQVHPSGSPLYQIKSTWPVHRKHQSATMTTNYSHKAPEFTKNPPFTFRRIHRLSKCATLTVVFVYSRTSASKASKDFSDTSRRHTCRWNVLQARLGPANG